MKYNIRFEFYTKNEPPDVYIQRNGNDILEVLEEPICKLGGKLELIEESTNIWDWRGPWSNDGRDWEPGPLAKQVLRLLIQND
jgi:hypothetical protein